jgi:hypothetical protein
MAERHRRQDDEDEPPVIAAPASAPKDMPPPQLHVTDPALRVVVETVIALARLVNPDDERVQKHIATLEALLPPAEEKKS